MTHVAQAAALAVLDDLHDLALDRLPDSLQLLCATVERHLRDRATCLPDPLGSPTVGQKAKSLRPLELQHVGEQEAMVRQQTSLQRQLQRRDLLP